MCSYVSTVHNVVKKDNFFGLIGFGAIGKKVCKLAKNFGAKVISYDPYTNSNLENEFNLNMRESARISKGKIF